MPHPANLLSVGEQLAGLLGWGKFVPKSNQKEPDCGQDRHIAEVRANSRETSPFRGAATSHL